MAYYEQWTLFDAPGADAVTVGVLRRDSLVAANTSRSVGTSFIEPEEVRGLRIRWRGSLTRRARLTDPFGRLWDVVGLEEVGRRRWVDLTVARYEFSPVEPPAPTGPFVAPPGWALLRDGAPFLELEIGGFLDREGLLIGADDAKGRWSFVIVLPSGITLADPAFQLPFNTFSFATYASPEQGFWPATVASAQVTRPVVGSVGIPIAQGPWQGVYNLLPTSPLVLLDHFNTVGTAGDLWPTSSRPNDEFARRIGLAPWVQDTEFDALKPNFALLASLSIGDTIFLNQGPYA